MPPSTPRLAQCWGPGTAVFLDGSFCWVQGRFGLPAFSYSGLTVMSQWANEQESTLLTQMRDYYFYYFRVWIMCWKKHKIRSPGFASWIWMLASSHTRVPLFEMPFLRVYLWLIFLPFTSDVPYFFCVPWGPLWHSNEAKESFYRIMFTT